MSGRLGIGHERDREDVEEGRESFSAHSEFFDTVVELVSGTTAAVIETEKDSRPFPAIQSCGFRGNARPVRTEDGNTWLRGSRIVTENLSTFC